MASQAMEMGARSLATRQWEALPLFVRQWVEISKLEYIELRYQAHYWQAQMDSLWTRCRLMTPMTQPGGCSSNRISPAAVLLRSKPCGRPPRPPA